MIPIYGSMSRPENPEEGLKELINGRLDWKGGDLRITLSTDEFTSLCPTTGQPDFSAVEIIYEPNQYYLESKTVKFYFWSFRDQGAHCESLAAKICDDVVKAISPSSCLVRVSQEPRGGIAIVSEARM